MAGGDDFGSCLPIERCMRWRIRSSHCEHSMGIAIPCKQEPSFQIRTQLYSVDPTLVIDWLATS